MRKIVKYDGITILYQKNNTNKATYCEFGINCGAFCEKIDGTAHYLEHMFFTETDKLSHQDIEKEKFLNRINAYTTFNTIQITFDQSSSLIKHCFEICSDMFFHSKITKEYVDKESEIIKTEINRKLTNPQNEITYKHEEKLFNNKKFAMSAAGTVESVKKITPKTLIDFREKYYFKENFSITIVTNKSLKYVKKLIKTYILPNLNSKNEKISNSDEVNFCEKSFVQIINKDVQNSIVVLNLNKITKETTVPKILKQVQLRIYLNTLLSKKLSKRLRDEKSFIYSISNFNFSNKKEICWGIKFETDSKNILPALQEINNVFTKTYESGFSKEDFDDFVTKNKLTEDMEYSIPGKEIVNMQNIYKNYGKFLNHKQTKKSFYSITLDELNSFYKENFKINKFFLSVMTSKDKKEMPTLKDVEKIFIKKE